MRFCLEISLTRSVPSTIPRVRVEADGVAPWSIHKTITAVACYELAVLDVCGAID
jgi:hypothetical protein